MAIVMQFLDIPYTPLPVRDTFREFDLYVAQPRLGDLDTDFELRLDARPLICFVHGGAWRAYAHPMILL
jgi:hypothetical protein